MACLIGRVKDGPEHDRLYILSVPRGKLYVVTLLKADESADALAPGVWSTRGTDAPAKKMQAFSLLWAAEIFWEIRGVWVPCLCASAGADEVTAARCFKTLLLSLFHLNHLEKLDFYIATEDVSVCPCKSWSTTVLVMLINSDAPKCRKYCRFGALIIGVCVYCLLYWIGLSNQHHQITLLAYIMQCQWNI